MPSSCTTACRTVADRVTIGVTVTVTVTACVKSVSKPGFCLGLSCLEKALDLDKVCHFSAFVAKIYAQRPRSCESPFIKRQGTVEIMVTLVCAASGLIGHEVPWDR
jgi:hypothetical protein